MEEDGDEEEVKKKKVVKKVKKVVKKKVKSASNEDGAPTADDTEKSSKKTEATKSDEESPAVSIGHSDIKTKADDKKQDETDKRKGKSSEDIKVETDVTYKEEIKEEETRTEEEITCDLKVNETKTEENEDEKNKGETEEKTETLKDGVEDTLLKLGKNVSFSPITQFFKGKKRSDKTDSEDAAAAKKSNLGDDKKHITAALTTVFLDTPGKKSNEGTAEKEADPDAKLPGSSEGLDIKGEDGQSELKNISEVPPEQIPKDNAGSAGMKFLGAMRKMVDVPMHAIKIKSKEVHPDKSEKLDQTDDATSPEDKKRLEDKEAHSVEHPPKVQSGTTGKKILGAMKRMVDVPMHAIKIKSHDEPQRGSVEIIEDNQAGDNVQSSEVHVEETPTHHPKVESETTGKKILGAMKKMVDVPMHAIKIRHKEEVHTEMAEKEDVDETKNNAQVTDVQNEETTSSPQKDAEKALEHHPKDEHGTTGQRFLGAMKRMVDVPMHAIKIKSKETHGEVTVKPDQNADVVESTQVQDEEVSSAPQSNVEDTSKQQAKEEPSGTGKKILDAMKKMVDVPMHAIKMKSSDGGNKGTIAETEEQTNINVERPKVQDEELSHSTQTDIDNTSKHLIKEEPSSAGKKLLGAMKKMVEVPMHAIKIKSSEDVQKEATIETDNLSHGNDESLKIQDEEVSSLTKKNMEENTEHPTKDNTGTTGKKILGAMKKMVEVPMHAIKIKSKDEAPCEKTDELQTDQRSNDIDSSETHDEEVKTESRKKEEKTDPEKPSNDESITKGRNIFGTMKKIIEAPMHAIQTKRKDEGVGETPEKLAVDQTDTSEPSKVQSDEGSSLQPKDIEDDSSEHPVKEERGVTGKKIIGAMKRMVEVPMHAIRIKGKEEAQMETPEQRDVASDTGIVSSEAEGENVYPLPPKSTELAAPELPPKDDASTSGKKFLGAMRKMVDVPMSAIRVKMDSISPTRKEKKDKTDNEIKEEDILEVKVKDDTGSPPLPPRNKTGPGAAKVSNKFRFWEKKRGKVGPQTPRMKAEKEIFELFSKNFFSDDPNRFSTLQPKKNIGPDGRIRESSLPPPSKLKGSDGGKSPKVPPKTWMWEELRRTRLKGGYPWTHLYKGSIDDAHWKEIMEHEYEYVDPRPELLRPETVPGGKLTPKGSPRVSPRATPEPERPKPQRRFIRIPDSEHVIIPLHGSSDEEHNPDRYEHPELVGQEEIGATPAKFQPTPSPSPSRRKAAAEPKLSEKLRTTAGHLGSKIKKTIPDKSKLRLPDKPKFLADIPQIKLPETPKFLTEKPKFLTEKPKFLTEKPKFLTEKPKFLTEKPKFLTEKPKFLTEKPKFLTERPKFLTERPKFLTERPKFLTERPKFLTERPKFLREGIKFPDRSKLTMPSIKLSKTRRSRTTRETSVKSEFGSEKNIFHSLKARTYPRFLNKRKKQGTKKTTPPPGQSKFDSESLPSTPRSKRNDKWTEVYKQKSVDEVKVASYTNGESFHERYSKREAKRASSSSVADSDREQVSSGSSTQRHRAGVIEEIDSDEFFVRVKGISREDVQVSRYLSSEIREAFRSPKNALASLDKEDFDDEEPLPPHRSKPKEYPRKDFNTFPLRPSRAKKSDETLEKPPRKFRSKKKPGSLPTLHRGRKGFDMELDVDVLTKEPPMAPKRRKSAKDLEPDEHWTTIEAEIVPDEGMAQDEVKVEYDVPVAPVRKSRSRGTSVADEDRTSRGAESLKSDMQIDDELNDEFQMEDDQKVKEAKEPMQIESIRMVEMTIVQSAAQEPPAYSNVSKLRPPRPPPPQKEVESGTLPRLKTKIMGHRHMQQLQTWKNQGVDLFFTYPRKAMKSIRKGPKRPVRNYSTICGPIRPPRRRKVFREPVYVDADIEPADSIPYIDEVTGGMKGRPLPPPPRPPLPRNDYLEGEIEPMVIDEPNALKALVGQDIADEALPAIPSQQAATRQEDVSDRMQGRPLPPPPRRKRSTSAASRKRETTPPLEAEVVDNYDGEEEEAIDARMTIDISEPITVLSVEQIEPVKVESDLVKSETALPTKVVDEPEEFVTRKITAEISQQTSLDIGEINASVQTDPLPDGAILDESEDAILKSKPLDSDEEPTIEKYLEKYENEFKLLGRQMTPSKTLEPMSITPPETTSAEEEFEDEVEVIEPEISASMEKGISEFIEQEIPETFEGEILDIKEKEAPVKIEKEIMQTTKAVPPEIIDIEDTSETQEKGIVESTEKQVTESLEKEIILTDEEAERNINKAETKIIEKAMPIQDEEPTAEEPTKEEPSKDKSDEKHEPTKTYDVPFSFPDRLHLTHLDVDNLNVSSLKASHILVSDLTGQSMQVTELTSRGGNLVVNGMELPPNFVQTLADEITAKVEDKLPQRQPEPIQPVVDIVQKLLDIQLQQPQSSTPQQQLQQPVTTTQPQVISQQKPLDEISPQESQAKESLEESQTEKPTETDLTSAPIRSESPHQPQKLTVVTAPPTVVVQTAAESISQLTPETGTLSDSIPTPRTTRNKGKKTSESARIVDDSEDELATTMPPKPTISRIIPVRPSTSKAIPSTSKSVPSTSQAVQPTSASGLTARQLLKELLKIWKNCMTEGFVACSNTVGAMFPEGQKRRDAQTAACVLFVIIIALFALGFGTDNTVHYHHWDFVPPR